MLAPGHAVLFVIAFGSFLGLGVVAPVLPFMALELGIAASLVPLILLVEPLLVAVVAPGLGRMSDRLGRRPVLLVLLAAAPLSYLLLAATEGLALFLASRVLAGLAHSAFGIVQAALADSTRAEQRVRAMALANLAYSLAFAAGALFTVLLLPGDRAEPRAAVFLALLVSTLSLVVAVLIFRPAKTDHGQAGALAGSLDGALVFPRPAARPLYPLLALLGLVSFAYAAMDTSIGVWTAQRLAWGVSEFAGVFVAGGLAAALSQVALLAPAAMARETTLARLGVAALASGLAILVIAENGALVYLAALLMGSGMAVAMSALQALLSQSLPGSAQGGGLGLSQAVIGLAWVIGPGWASLTLAYFDPSWPFLGGAVVLLIALACLSRSPFAHWRSPPTAQPGATP